MDRAARTRRIIELIDAVPAGRVASYGQIARLAGLPRGARQVAYTLRERTDGLSLPWQRVLRATGHIAFDAGSPQFERQASLLRGEGVLVIRGRVDMKRYGWTPDLDELLWRPSVSWDEA